MKITSVKVLLSSFLALAMMLVILNPVLASGPQSWNLDTIDTSILPTDDNGLAAKDLMQMEKRDGPGDNGQSGDVILTALGAGHDSQIWIADQAALGDVIFPSSPTSWLLELVTDSQWVAENIPSNCIVEIGEWDGTQFNKFISATQQDPPLVFPDHPNLNPNQLIITFVLQVANEVVHKNNYLAVKVTNQDNIPHTIFCGEVEDSTCLTSTGTDPGYPTPEPLPPVSATSQIGTVILISGLALCSTLLLRTRIKRYKSQNS